VAYTLTLHLPAYYARWLTGTGYANTPFTDSMGQQWTIVNDPGAKIVVFAPANYQDRLSGTIDIKALSGASIMAQPGGINGPDVGSMTVNNFSVNYN
jgi:hypothetical protein